MSKIRKKRNKLTIKHLHVIKKRSICKKFILSLTLEKQINALIRKFSTFIK